MYLLRNSGRNPENLFCSFHIKVEKFDSDSQDKVEVLQNDEEEQLQPVNNDKIKERKKVGINLKKI